MHPEFPLDPAIIHLNHAGLSPWPRRTAEAVRRFAEENSSASSLHAAAWARTEWALREQCRQLLNAPSTDSIALLKNTSEALSIVAYGLDWKPGDNVVCAAEEFPSNRVVWQSLHARFGVDTRLAEISRTPDAELALLDRCDARTRVLTVSSVQYASGLRLDLERLGDACRRSGIAFCVDAIQSLGALPFDVQACHADFVMAEGRKWLLAPEGLAVFYCSPAWLTSLKLHQYGWHMLDPLGEYERLEWREADTARRFECGAPPSLGVQALHASMSLLLETGMDTVSRLIQENIGHLLAGLQALPVDVVTPLTPERRAGILSFVPREQSVSEVHRSLAASGVLCAVRAGAIRLSPHFYTETDVLDRALAYLAQALR
jgi:cysteine desulfurase / selenocysteine lyase